MTNNLICAWRDYPLLPLFVEIGDDQNVGLGDEFTQHRAICGARYLANAELARDGERALIPLATDGSSTARFNNHDARASLSQ